MLSDKALISSFLRVFLFSPFNREQEYLMKQEVDLSATKRYRERTNVVIDE